MEVQLTPEQQNLLNELVQRTGRGSNELLGEAVEHLAAYDRWFREEVEKGLKSLREGRVLEHDEVKVRFARYLGD